MVCANMSHGFNLPLEMEQCGTYKIKFFLWENKDVKGQHQKKCKVELELKSQVAKKIDLTIEEAADDMKLSLWRAMQGIKDKQLLVSVLSRVVAKELSLEEMVTEFNK